MQLSNCRPSRCPSVVTRAALAEYGRAPAFQKDLQGPTEVVDHGAPDEEREHALAEGDHRRAHAGGATPFRPTT
eukprot:15172634-Alexandrium_andersonii.AAC.1